MKQTLISKNFLTIALSTLFFFFSFPLSQAQWFQKGSNLDGVAANDEFGHAVSLSADGLTLAVGAWGHDKPHTTLSPQTGMVRIFYWNGADWIQKGGDIYGTTHTNYSGESVSLSADGNTVAIGAPFSSSAAGQARIFDWNGTAWIQRGSAIYGTAGSYSGKSIKIDSSGNTVVVGAWRNSANGYYHGSASVYHWNGVSWVQRGLDLFGEADQDYFGISCDISNDGNTIIIGGHRNDGNSSDAGHARIFDWDGTAWIQRGTDIDGDIYDFSGWAVSMNGDGNTVAIGTWWQSHDNHTRVYYWDGTAWTQKGTDILGESSSDGAGASVDLSDDGNIIAIGAVENTGDGIGSECGSVRMYAWDGSQWNLIGEVNGSGGFDYAGRSVSLNADGSAVAIGSPYNSINGYKAGRARVFSSKGIFGFTYNDLNQNCTQDLHENDYTYRYLTLDPGNIIIQTNENGFWYLDSLPLGTFTITPNTSNGLWQPTCPQPQTFNITNQDTSIQAFSMGFYSNLPCSSPDISISAPFLRPGFSNQKIYVRACNDRYATETLKNSYVIVQIDSLLTIDTASIPYTALGNNQYHIVLPDTIYPNQCHNFWLSCTLSPSAILNSTLCMEANLYPVDSCSLDTIPNPYPANTISPCNSHWDRSSLVVNGSCEGDSVRFIIYNTGAPTGGDMDCFSPVRIYLDGQYILLDSIQLVGGDSIVFTFYGNGQTWRLEVDQHPLHPGNSQPSITIENCGTGIWTPDLVNIFPHDDANPVKDIYCGLVRGSYDPNDKRGFPLGLGSNHDIQLGQDLEYIIRFQNTGTDTAFNIVIRDTLAVDLDVFSVQSGVSSDDYSFKIYGPRILEWTFNNIMLPDSNVNEPASHGFVSFKVKQVPNLPLGTIIENSAAIYFDFNLPIITNTSWHTLYEPQLVLNQQIVQPIGNLDHIKIYPNPTTGRVHINQGRQNEIHIQVLDNLGRVILEQNSQEVLTSLDISALPLGLYYIGINDGKQFITKKIIKS